MSILNVRRVCCLFQTAPLLIIQTTDFPVFLVPHHKERR